MKNVSPVLNGAPQSRSFLVSPSETQPQEARLSATGTAVLTSGVLTSVTITAGGSGYTSVPTVAFTRNASDTGWRDQTTQTARPVTLTDEAIPDVWLVRAMMLALGFEALAEMGAPGMTKTEWMAAAGAWTARANSLKIRNGPRDENEGVFRLTNSAVGSRWGRYGRSGLGWY